MVKVDSPKLLRAWTYSSSRNDNIRALASLYIPPHPVRINIAIRLNKLWPVIDTNNKTNIIWGNDTKYSENINEPTAHITAETSEESIISETHDIEKQEIIDSEPSNGLENFGLQEEGNFELFDKNSEAQNTLTEEKKETEEDELEIPAFLRRQKN